jgi:hypothetical protein
VVGNKVCESISVIKSSIGKWVRFATDVEELKGSIKSNDFYKIIDVRKKELELKAFGVKRTCCVSWDNEKMKHPFEVLSEDELEQTLVCS